MQFVSVARWYDPFVSVGVACAAYVLLRQVLHDPIDLAVAMIMAVMVPMILCEWVRARPLDAAARSAPITKALLHTAALKWLGVMVGIAALYVVWWAFPMYDAPTYAPLFSLAESVVPTIAVVSAIYLVLAERLKPAPSDFHYQCGLLATLRWRKVDWEVMKEGSLGLLVRIFFLPLNFCTVVNFAMLVRAQESAVLTDTASYAQMHSAVMSAIYLVMIVTIVPGYLFSARLLNTHFRKVDKTWFAWAVTMACYPPFVAGVFGLWFNYHGEFASAPYTKEWMVAFANIPWLLSAVGACIIVSELIHLWGEAIMGIRASNLSHRGIITNGPFRATRHPIYVSKCVGWCLIAVPFLMGDTWLDSVRLTLLFTGVCGIYLMRAWAEERLLATDPDYVTYALWVDKHGMFAWVGKHLPWLTFEWKLRHWGLDSTRA